MALSKKDFNNFNHARVEAENSDFHSFHTGCVIVYKNAIIGRGFNSIKTHPKQKRYNHKYRDIKSDDYRYESLHAEMSALASVPYSIDQAIDWNKVKVYVYRISPGNKNGLGLAKPCPACENAIRNKGIKHVYYTTYGGYAYERYI